MKIESVITCVNYADFLAYTLPINRAMFDRIIVATTPDDQETRRLCEFWNVACVPTKAFSDRGMFCKGAGINAGLAQLGCDGWIVHMDADIVLPPRFRELIDRANLDPSCLYGADRMMVRSHEDWLRFLAAPALQHENDIFVHPQPFPIGVRIATSAHAGYLPIGYFQLWHGANPGATRYPEEHNDASRGDMQFAAKWPRARRGFLPEVIVYHLESAPASMGANWYGRTTPRFGLAPTSSIAPPTVESASVTPLPAREVPSSSLPTYETERAPAGTRAIFHKLLLLAAAAVSAYILLI